ncbi:MAG: hypothetical protein H6670_13870 [Anaerolineaceae bacterium]|nr:hypothetical protein [Anaerolineaceae bacterium]
MTTTRFDNPLFEDDPILGRFVAYFPSYRLRLLIIGGLLYGIPVLVLQVLLANVEGASVLIVAGYAMIALLVGWYVLHLWNREVTVYENGFTYRRGGQLGYFRFAEITRIHQHAERVSYFGIIKRDVITYTLNTDQEEVLQVNAVYKDVAKLGLLLESKITAARQPLVEAELAQGKSVEFGSLTLAGSGISYANRQLFWDDFGKMAIERGALRLYDRQLVEWAAVPLAELDNLMLLVNLLRDHQPTPESTPA